MKTFKTVSLHLHHAKSKIKSIVDLWKSTPWDKYDTLALISAICALSLTAISFYLLYLLTTNQITL